MPKGLFLLIDDPLKGLQVKCQYTPHALEELPRNFYAQLFSMHGESESESYLENVWENYRIISYAPKYTSIKNTKVGVLALIFDYHERFDNLHLFLKRNMRSALKFQTEATLKEIFEVRLKRYCSLNQLFETIEIENIEEILIVSGNSNYQTTILHLGAMHLSKLEIAILFKKMLKLQTIPHFKYYKLNKKPSNVFLLVKSQKDLHDIDKTFRIIGQYMERHLNYALEILALFLLAPVISLCPSQIGLYREFSDQKLSVLRVLLKSKDYSADFNQLIANLIKGDGYLASTMDTE